MEICAVFPFQLIMARAGSAAVCASLVIVPLCRVCRDVSSLESSLFPDFSGKLMAATARTGWVSFQSFSDYKTTCKICSCLVLSLPLYRGHSDQTICPPPLCSAVWIHTTDERHAIFTVSQILTIERNLAKCLAARTEVSPFEKLLSLVGT